MVSDQPTVLLIEDEEIARTALQRGLEHNGYDVDVADSGKAGIAKFKDHPFDIVLSDLRMPDVDGIEVLEEIRRIDPEAIVLIVTGHASVETALDAMEKGAVDYFAKPVNFKHMNRPTRYIVHFTTYGASFVFLMRSGRLLRWMPTDLRSVI